MAGPDYFGMGDKPPESLIKFPQRRLGPATGTWSITRLSIPTISFLASRIRNGGNRDMEKDSDPLRHIIISPRGVGLRPYGRSKSASRHWKHQKSSSF
jgi:hypothetical protein